MNVERLEKTLQKVNEFGYSEEGINRIAYTKAEQEAVQYLIELFKKEGMNVKVDSIGNVIARREGMDPTLPAVVTGSHIDTVYNGGKYDGTIGVVTGLELIRTLNEKNIRTKHPIEIIIFACEESARFGVSTIGSSALIGEFQQEYLTLTDKDGISLESALLQFGYNVNNINAVKRKKEDIKIFYELHVEQGPVLEKEKKQIGVVTGIATPTRFQIEIIGEAAHSGSTPMDLRKDALLGAAEMILALERSANAEKDHGTVATVGTCEVIPGAMNVVPGKVEMSIDIRSISSTSKDRVVTQLFQTISQIENKRSLTFCVHPLYDEEPINIDDNIVKRLVELCEKLKFSYRKMPSGAGHDAMMMAKAFPTGLIFVPSKDGISHNKDEYTSKEQIYAGAMLLKEAILDAAIVTEDSLQSVT